MKLTDTSAAFAADQDAPIAGAHSSRQTLSADDFKSFFRQHPAGVAIVTAHGDDGPVALTVTSLLSVSAMPPYLLFSVSDSSSSAPTILAAETVIVHLADRENLEIANRCATSGVDRFADPSCWVKLATGEPRFVAVATWLRGRIVSRMRVGAATLVLVEALEGAVQSDDEREPLIYHNRGWAALAREVTANG